MKKNFLYAVLAASLLLCGCEKEQLIDEFSITERTDISAVQIEKATTAASTEEPSQTTFAGLGETEETTAETSAVSEDVYSEGEEMLLKFIESMQTGESKFEYGEMGYGDPFEVYSFWDDFTIDDYSYKYRGDGIYDVKLTCSDSTCELFPNGESEWVFNSTYLTCFIPAEREENHNVRINFGDPDYDGKDSTLYTAYNAAMNFSMFTGAFEADGEWFENYTDINVHGFFHAYNSYFIVNDYETGETYDVTPEEFAAAVKKLYNINMTAQQAREMADETGFMRKDCAHGGSWLYTDFENFEETEDEVKVTINYYGDSLYLYATIQSEYTFSKNEDGSITLQRVEKIFDRGYEPAGGAV